MAKADPIGLREAQAQLLCRWRNLLAAGGTRLGWKIGVNDLRTQKFYGLPHPVVGYMTGESLIHAPKALGRQSLLMAEPELALRIDHPEAASGGAGKAAKAIGAICPAMELLDFNQPRQTVEELLGHNIFHLGVTLGDWTPPEAALLGHVRLSTGGKPLDEAAIKDTLPPLGEIVHLVATTLASHGERLEPGDVIISGAMTRPVPLEVGRQLHAEFGELGHLCVQRPEVGRIHALAG